LKTVRKIRSIEDTTSYDVLTGLKRKVRQIEKGEHGAVMDAIVILRRKREGHLEIDSYFYGTGDTPNYFFMANRCMQKCLESGQHD